MMYHSWELDMRRGIMMPDKKHLRKDQTQLKVRLKDIRNTRKFYDWARREGYPFLTWENKKHENR